MKLGHKRPFTLTFTIMEKLLMVIVEVDIGIRPDPIPPIIQVTLVYCWIFPFVIIIEVEVGLSLATIIHITIVDYKFSTQVLSRSYYKVRVRRR